MEIKEILLRHGVRFKKNLGQNFLTDPALLAAIVRDGGVCPGDTVVEIGTGAGTLTRAIAESGARVVTFDVDDSLTPVWAETLAGLDNVTTVIGDVLKMSDEEVKAKVGTDSFRVVANIPYYITTPLMMRWVESGLDVRSITVTIQEEVARRLVAEVGSPDYGAITLAVRLWGRARITRKVPRTMFRPVPNVDSAVVTVERDDSRYIVKDKAFLSKLMRAGFAMRRKTLVNNFSVALGRGKDEIRTVLEEAGFDPNIRGEALSVEDYIALADRFRSEQGNV